MRKYRFWPEVPQLFEILLMVVFACSLIAHLTTAIIRHDLECLDEHYQVLEPASSMVFHRGFLVWEWQQQYRSWVMPFVFAPFFFVAKLFGVTGGLGLVYGARLIMAFLSTAVCLRFHRLLCYFKLNPWLHLLSVMYMALSTPMLRWSVTTLADTCVMLSFVALAPFTFRQTAKLCRDGGSRQEYMLLGLAWTFSGFFKLQGVVLGLVPLLIIAWTLLRQQYSVSRLFSLALGASIPLLTIGFIDWITYGQPFRTVILQALYGSQIAECFGVTPWFDYYFRIKKNIGHWWIIFPVCQMSLFCLKPQLARSFYPAYRYGMLAFVGSIIGYVGLHLTIAHKETRFLLPIFPLLFLWTTLVFSQIRLPDIPLKYAFVPACLLIPCCSYFCFHRMQQQTTGRTFQNIAALEEHVRQDAHQKTCLMLFRLPRLIMRGNLVVGDKISIIERSESDVVRQDYLDCDYVITYRDALPDFSLASKYQEIDATKFGYILLKARRG